MRRIIIIGKNGYIADNYRLLSNLAKKSLNFITTSQIDSLNLEKNKYVNSDVTDVLWLGFGTSYHKYEHGNTEITYFRNILKNEVYSKSRITLISSGGTVYGGKQYPYKESGFLEARNAYGRHKLLLEKILIESGLNYVILRLGNIYGGKTSGIMTKGVINTWVSNLIQGKNIKMTSPASTIQDYIYMRDLVEALDQVLNSEVSNSIFNIANGSPVTLGTIIKLLREHFGKFEVIEQKKKQMYDNYVLDTNRINSTLNWSPRYDMRLGIKDYICRDMKTKWT